jgi:hypothetical protein
MNFIDAVRLIAAETEGMKMNRRAYIKIALVASGVAISYFWSQLLDMANTTVQSLENEKQFGSTSFTTDDWKITPLLSESAMKNQSLG